MVKTRLVLTLALGALTMTGVAHAQPRAAEPAVTRPDEGRYSGRIREVSLDGSTLVLEEIVAWTGPGTGVVDRSIRITPQTSIRLVQPAPWRNDQGAMPGWDSRTLKASDLRPGDFVTVTTGENHRSVALGLQVVRPAAQ